MHQLKLFGGVRISRIRGAVALGAAMAVIGVSLVVTVPAQAAASTCTVTYVIPNDWGSGFTANVTIGSTMAVNGWTLGWTFPGNQLITTGWNGTFTQTGSAVSVKNASFNGTIVAGGSVSIGFNANYSGANAKPTAFTLNGVACGGSGPTASPSTASPSTRPSSTPIPPTASPSASRSGPTPSPSGPTPTPTPSGSQYTGFATWFSGIGGTSYGGCGLAQADLDTQYFVALNVQNTPGDYTSMFPRPITGANLSKIGLFNNGLNCGRWVQVVIGNDCNGVNDGAAGQPFCRGGTGLFSDKYNGAVLNMVVADSCQDGNAWCRDSQYHLDLSRNSLNQFLLNGVPVGDMDPAHWNNRQISWHFIQAPSYTGDIQLGFIRDAQPWWAAIAIKHLLNGMHGVDYWNGTSWVKASMDSDMGDDYIIGPTSITNGVAGTSYQIRVYDASDQLINGGRIYSFSLPASCSPQCPNAFNPVTYTVS
jgi:hypothetical protein